VNETVSSCHRRCEDLQGELESVKLELESERARLSSVVQERDAAVAALAELK
jgi:hypothetical protein